MIPRKKIQTGILLTGVLLVWGVIGIKLCKDLWHKGDTSTAAQIPARESRDTVAGVYALHGYTRDPFLSILKDTALVTEEDTPEVKKVVMAPKPVVTLPEYCGVVQNREERMAILRLQDKVYFLKKSEQLNELRVFVITDDTVVLTAAGTQYKVGLKRADGDNRQASR